MGVFSWAVRTFVVRKPCVAVAIAFACQIAASLADEPAGKTEAKSTAAPSSAPAAASAKLFCLHTEYLPYKQKEALKYRLLRELARQAVLIVARDELGLATRDETLGEDFPESVKKAKDDVYVSARSQYDGSVRFQIWLASKPEELLPTKKEKYEANVVLNQVASLHPRIHGELADKLRALGFDGKPAAANEKNLPTDAIEGQLLELNFVSQFMAVRAAHAAIAEKGESIAWLSVLARGYANLSLLNQHHWKSDTEAFAARALLYAERMAAAHPDKTLSHATRAYVRAIVGLHGPALDELKAAETVKNEHSEESSLPGWCDVISPYCSFEREALTSVGDRRPSLRQLAQRLSFEQHRAYGDQHWMLESAKQAMSVCPEDYSVYAALTGSHATLAVGRTGAYYGPAALAHFLPGRLAELRELPAPVRSAALGIEKEPNAPADVAEDKSKSGEKPPAPSEESVGEYAAGTIHIVEALREASSSADDKGQPSWSALGELIFEEQFVQAANYLKISQNATESSFDDMVKSMMPAVKGHRYARHIQSYAKTIDGKGVEFANVIGDMEIVDPRGNMRPMLFRTWLLPDAKGDNRRGSDASWHAFLDRGFTFNGGIEAYGELADTWWNTLDTSMRNRWASDFKIISPRSPQALRFAIALTNEPTYEQAIQWEAEAGEDPAVYVQLAYLFAASQHYDDAIRAYERSIKLSPTKGAFVGLANTYRASGQENLWQPTLERFFEVESLGLEQASVHSIIANDLIDKGKLEEAEPHAAAAAETWAAWGLVLASRVNEGLGRWDESEKWIREMSTAYPSSSGAEWYFWCRRTGRGNIDDARKVAQIYFAGEWIKKDIRGLVQLWTFHLAENNARAAFSTLKDLVELNREAKGPDEDIVRSHFNTILVARELKETSAEQTALKTARLLSESVRAKYPKLGSVYIAICDVLENKPPTAEQLAALDQDMEESPKQLRVTCQYILGRALDMAGNKEAAEKYYKQCVTRGPYENYPATLAGKYLCDQHKTSRP